MSHPTDHLVLQAAIKVLREHSEGRSVDPSRLAWAVQIAHLNPSRVTEEFRLTAATAKANA